MDFSQQQQPSKEALSPAEQHRVAEACLKPRVLVVAPQPFYQDRGTPIALRHVLRALSQLDFQVDVLAFPGGTSPDIPGVRYFRIANPLRIRTVPIGFSVRKLWLDLFLYVALRKRLRACRYGCIHAVEEAAFLAVWEGRRRGVPVIYDMQSSMAEQMAKKRLLNNKLAKRILGACERWLVRNATATMTSAGLAHRVRTETSDARVQEWQYPSQMPVATPEQADRLRAALGIERGRPVVMYTGNFEEYQGLPLLIDAAPMVLARVPEAVFVLLGAEEPNATIFAAQLEKLIPLGAYRLVDRQPQQKVPAFLAIASVAVSPREYGGNLPLKILEYLGAGCAIVATSIPAHCAILNDELAVLAEPNARALSEAIIEVLQDRSKETRLQVAARKYAESNLAWVRFRHSVRELYEGLWHRVAPPGATLVSVIIPARNTADFIGKVVHDVRQQRCSGVNLEVIVVDDGSEDETKLVAQEAGAVVVTRGAAGDGGNPAAARNLGAAAAHGDPIIFLDADCTPTDGWLETLLAAHAEGAVCVGGSLALPPGLSASARWDYYCGWYHVHPGRSPGNVPNHPPCNLSVRRAAFAATSGFVERQPIAYSHEELGWQAELRRVGKEIYFEPTAVVHHWNRPGFANLLRRNYRWAYSAIESKAETGISRMPWLYRYPRLLIAASIPLALAQAVYIVGCWLRAGVVEPLFAFPVILAARMAYAGGMMAGGLRWLRHGGTLTSPARRRWV